MKCNRSLRVYRDFRCTISATFTIAFGTTLIDSGTLGLRRAGDASADVSNFHGSDYYYEIRSNVQDILDENEINARQ